MAIRVATTLAVLLLYLVARTYGQRNPGLGLSPNNLQKNGIHIGFVPAWGEPLHRSTCSSLNANLSAPMSIVGAYAQIDPKDTKFSQLDPYITDLNKTIGDKPVLAIALMPAQGFRSVTQTVANNIAAKMAQLNTMGFTIWLRYAHEMNGNWYAWGRQPAAFIESWNMVARTVKTNAPDTYMLWSPNSLMNDDVNGLAGYTPYWPANDTVDIVGLSFYAYGGLERLNILPDTTKALETMIQFDEMYAAPNNVSFVLSETAASFTRNASTRVSAPGNASESDIKLDWLNFLTSDTLKSAAPNYVSSVWFEVIKDENAAGNTPIKEEDFRLISGNTTLAAMALTYLEKDDSAAPASPPVIVAADIVSPSLVLATASNSAEMGVSNPPRRFNAASALAPPDQKRATADRLSTTSATIVLLSLLAVIVLT